MKLHRVNPTFLSYRQRNLAKVLTSYKNDSLAAKLKDSTHSHRSERRDQRDQYGIYHTYHNGILPFPQPYRHTKSIPGNSIAKNSYCSWCRCLTWAIQFDILNIWRGSLYDGSVSGSFWDQARFGTWSHRDRVGRWSIFHHRWGLDTAASRPLGSVYTQDHLALILGPNSHRLRSLRAHFLRPRHSLAFYCLALGRLTAATTATAILPSILLGSEQHLHHLVPFSLHSFRLLAYYSQISYRSRLWLR